MKQSLLAGVCAGALVLGAGSGANAADMDHSRGWAPDFYISLFGGVAIPEDIDGTLDTGGSSFDWDQELDEGFVIGGALGVRVWNNFRIEGEVSYSELNADDAVFTGAGGSTYAYAGDGDVDALFLLANVWYDIPLDSAIKPYIGGGVGVGFVDMNISLTGGGLLNPDGSDEGFAFQAGAGFKYALNDWVSLELGYRFKGILDVDVGDGANPGVFDYDTDIYIHQVLAGVTFEFNGLSGP